MAYDLSATLWQQAYTHGKEDAATLQPFCPCFRKGTAEYNAYNEGYYEDMTRINCIPVTELTDKHLLAEYRELPRVFALSRKPHRGEDIPQQYTLGKGHVKFFYDKLGWCYERQHELYNEMKRRGFKPTYDPYNLFLEFAKDKVLLWCDWQPTEAAMLINRARIQERLNGR